MNPCLIANFVVYLPCGILPHVANSDNRSATVLVCKCSLLCNKIPIATHTRNSTAPSLLWYGLVKSAQQRTAFSNDPTGVPYWVRRVEPCRRKPYVQLVRLLRMKVPWRRGHQKVSWLLQSLHPSFSHLPSAKSGLRCEYLYSCGHTGTGRHCLRSGLSKRHSRAWVPLLTWGRKQIQFSKHSVL
jgi:hypothetical protein